MDTVRLFKDLAKVRLKGARAGDQAAVQLVAAGRPDPGSWSLQQVQDQVAVEAGYPSWRGLLAATEADRRLAALMTRAPWLCDSGMGPSQFYRTREERKAGFAASRLMLRGQPPGRGRPGR